MLTEFEHHLSESRQRLTTAKELEIRTTKLLVDVSAGIEHLYDKLEKIKAVRCFFRCCHCIYLTLFQVQFRAANNIHDKLTEAELRITNLLEEIESRKTELGNVNLSEVRGVPYLFLTSLTGISSRRPWFCLSTTLVSY